MPQFNEAIFLWSLLQRPESARVFASKWDPMWFHDAIYIPIYEKIVIFLKEKGIPPSINTLRLLFQEEDKENYEQKIKFILDDLEAIDVDISEQIYNLDKAKDVAIVRSMQEILSKQNFLKMQEMYKGNELLQIMQQWMHTHIGIEEDKTFNIDEAVHNLISLKGFNSSLKSIPIGIDIIDDWTGGGLRPGQLGIIMSASGHGKCHGKGTKILMYSGMFKNIESISPGELVMGPDSKPRKVLNTITGFGKLFEITPIKGKPFVCNDEHVLSLQYCSSGHNTTKSLKGEIKNISIKDYINLSNNQKNLLKLWRPEIINYNYNHNLNVDPYFVGLYLGNGTKKRTSSIAVSFRTPEIYTYLINWANRNSLQIREVKDNGCWQLFFKGFNLNKNWLIKYVKNLYNEDEERIIPFEYKTSSEQDRLQLLAGLLDTDGFLNYNCFEIATKYKTLADDIEFVARSLGFGVSNKETIKTIKSLNFKGKYFILQIFGDINRIPNKVLYKKASQRKQIKSVLRTGFDIKEKGFGDYYGFQLDGDQLYLLEDLTVLHNSVSLIMMSQKVATLNEIPAWYITNEITMEEATERFLSRLTGENISHIIKDPFVALNKWEKHWKGKIGNNLLISEINREITTDEIEALMLKHSNIYGWKPAVICLDYLERMRPNTSGHTRANEWTWIGSIAQDLSRLCKRHKIVVWTAVQTNRAGLSADRLDMTMAQGSIRQLQEATAVIAMNQTYLRTNEQGDEEIGMTWRALKMRHSKKPSNPVTVKCNLSTMKITNEVVEFDEINRENLDEEEETPAEKQKRKRKNKLKRAYKLTP